MLRMFVPFLLSLLLTGNAGLAGVLTYDDRLYRCFISGDMQGWQRVIADLEQEYNSTKSGETEFQLLHAQYGFIGFLLGSKRTSLGERYIARADGHVANLHRSNFRRVEVAALEAAILAYKISVRPYRAVFLGPRSARLIGDALEIDPNNPYALIEKGNYRHYAPQYLGGNPAEAAALYQRGIAEIESLGKTQSWWYLNALVQLAIAAEKSKNYTLASQTYRKILHIEPQLRWVKDELYPKFLEKHGKVQQYSMKQ